MWLRDCSQATVGRCSASLLGPSRLLTDLTTGKVVSLVSLP